MRSVLLPVLTALLGAAAAFACSSSDPAPATPDAGSATRVEEADEESSSGRTSSSGGEEEEEDGGSSGGTSSGGTSSGGTSSGTIPYDGGASVDGGDEGTRCLADSVKAKEGNDTEETATVLPTRTDPVSFCGKLTAGDEDYARFVMPAGSFDAKVAVAWSSGPLKVELVRNGAPANGENFPAAGQPLFIKVSNNGATLPSDYLVTFDLVPK